MVEVEGDGHPTSGAYWNDERDGSWSFVEGDREKRIGFRCLVYSTTRD